MSKDIPESDWRQFRRVHQEPLDLFCQQTLDELGTVIYSMDGTAYERYSRAYRLLIDRDKEMARAFDNPRRSRAIIQLATMRHMGLLTDEQLSGFSEQTQQKIKGLDSLWDAGSDKPPSD